MDVTKPFTSGETAIKAQLQAFRKQAARQAVSKAPPEKEQVPTADTIQIKEQLRHFRRRTGCGHGGIQLPPITEGSLSHSVRRSWSVSGATISGANW